MVVARVFIVLLGLVLPGVSGAVDLNLSADTSTQYDNNVFRSENNEENDVSFRFGPTVRVSDEESKFSYSLQYNPVYEVFIDHSDLNDLSHFASGNLSYAFSDRTSLAIAESFSATQSVNTGAFNDTNTDGNDNLLNPDAESARDDIYQNSVSLSLRHNFSPRMIGQLVFANDYYDSANSGASRGLSYQGTSSLTYALNARNRVGGGGGVTYQTFEETLGNPGSDTLTYQIFGSWVRTFGESTELSIRAGPAFIDNSQSLSNSSIPPGTTGVSSGDDEDLRVAIFADVGLTHRWTQELTSAVSYNRSDSGVSSLGASSISDRVTLSTSWNPARRWNFGLRGDWVRRESPTDSGQFTGSNDDQLVDTTYWSASARAAYRVSKRGSITARLTYQNQDTKNGGRFNNSTFENVLGFVGFRYDLDTFRF